MSTIDITGLSKVEVLKALYNASAPVGLGRLHAERGSLSDSAAVEHTQWAITKCAGHVDYVLARPIKVNLLDDQMDVKNYERDNGGEGAARRALEAHGLLRRGA